MKNQVNLRVLLSLYLIIIFFLSMFATCVIDACTLQSNIEKSEPLVAEDVEVPIKEINSYGSIPQYQVISYSYEDLKYMSCLIWCEAGNQCEAGQEAVGIVVMNRVSSDKFEDTIKGVIYQKGQFSPVSSGKIDKALTMFSNGELPKECISAAIYALEGNTEVIYGEEAYDIDYLYFNGTMKNPELKIQDHYFK